MTDADYLKHCRVVDADTANAIVDAGTGIISSSRGLRLSDGNGHHKYTAYGVFPANLRGGNRFEMGVYPEGTLRLVTLKDVICSRGVLP